MVFEQQDMTCDKCGGELCERCRQCHDCAAEDEGEPAVEPPTLPGLKARMEHILDVKRVLQSWRGEMVDAAVRAKVQDPDFMDVAHEAMHLVIETCAERADRETKARWRASVIASHFDTWDVHVGKERKPRCQVAVRGPREAVEGMVSLFRVCVVELESRKKMREAAVLRVFTDLVAGIYGSVVEAPDPALAVELPRGAILVKKWDSRDESDAG